MFFLKICSVFWDLYCAAPERRDQCDHSSEAKAFHDYVSCLIEFVSRFNHIFFKGFVSSGYGVNGIGHVSLHESVVELRYLIGIFLSKLECWSGTKSTGTIAAQRRHARWTRWHGTKFLSGEWLDRHYMKMV